VTTATRFAIGLTGFLLIGLAAPILGPSVSADDDAQSVAGTGAERTTWYFYKVKWGYQDEFLDLFQKNHYPVLKAQLGSRLTAIRTYTPTYHGDGRADWTFAVALTFKNAAAMMDSSAEPQIVQKLYPDQALFRKEEARRFEVLDAHWDVPLNEVNFETRTLTRR
jgi:hypothetical protein